MMNVQVMLSLSVLFLMLMDPLGNLPIFVSVLKGLTPRRYRQVVLRESVIALVLMGLTLGVGNAFLSMLRVSEHTFTIAGGLILLLIGLKMVFSSLVGGSERSDDCQEEPFIVPLAIPLICGPGLIAMLIALHGPLFESLAGLVVAWLVQLVVLLFGKHLASLLGHRGISAMESLMGLLLTAISVGMILDGVNHMYHIGGVA